MAVKNVWMVANSPWALSAFAATENALPSAVLLPPRNDGTETVVGAIAVSLKTRSLPETKVE